MSPVGWLGYDPPTHDPPTLLSRYTFLSQAQESFWHYDVIRCRTFDK